VGAGAFGRGAEVQLHCYYSSRWKEGGGASEGVEHTEPIGEERGEGWSQSHGTRKELVEVDAKKIKVRILICFMSCIFRL